MRSASGSRSQEKDGHLDREDEAAVCAVGSEQLTSTRRWRGLEGGQDGEVVGKAIWTWGVYSGVWDILIPGKTVAVGTEMTAGEVSV